MSSTTILYGAKKTNIDTGLSLSFSPFYFIGIKIEVEGEGENAIDYEFEYDLNGRLRKYSFEDKHDQEVIVKLSEKSSKIKFPDFKNFTLEK